MMGKDLSVFEKTYLIYLIIVFFVYYAILCLMIFIDGIVNGKKDFYCERNECSEYMKNG